MGVEKMIKAMMVDSEIDNVNNFRVFIRKNFSEIKLVKSAVTVNDFYKNLLENKPDLVIMEMRFFGNKAMTNIPEIMEEYPETKFIIYGNSTEGDYMKKLCEMGAVTFMYRPVKPSDLRRAITQALKVFETLKESDEQQKKLYKEYHEQLLVFETKFFETLIKGRLTNDIEISEGMEYFDMKIDEPYRVCALRIDHFKKVVLALDETEKHLLVFRILKKINSFFEKGKAFINSFNEIVIILGQAEDLEECINQLKTLIEEIQAETKVGVSIGVGKAYEDAKNIQTSYNEAVGALRYRCIMGYGSAIPIEFTEPENNITYSYPSEREETLVFTAIMGDYKYCLKILDELFDALEKPNISVTANMLQQLVMNILISISRHAAEQGLNIVAINKFFPTADIFEIKRTTQAHQILEIGLKDFCVYMHDLREEKEEELVDKVKEFINEHYCETITLTRLSTELNCSTEYMKKIISTGFGNPLPEYLAKLRIEKAKELILSTSLTDDVIGVNVGYDDLIKFRSVFKQVEGYTIGDFRYIKDRRIGRI